MLAEQYDAANLRLTQAQKNIAAVSARLTAAQKDTDRIRGIVGRRAAEIYMGAGAQTPLDGLDVASAQEVGVRAKYAATTADRDARLLGQLAASKEDLKSARTTLEAAEKQAQSEVDALEREPRRGRVGEREAKAIAVEGQGRTRNVDRGGASRRGTRRAERAATRSRASNACRPVSSGSGSRFRWWRWTRSGWDQHAGRARAVGWRRAGRALRAAATRQALSIRGHRPELLRLLGPDDDGVGVGGRRHAAQFVRPGDHVPPGGRQRHEPGDLVIYYADHHHVGLYVGGGMTISATHTGDFVRLQPVFRQGFQFAVRPG